MDATAAVPSDYRAELDALKAQASEVTAYCECGGIIAALIDWFERMLTDYERVLGESERLGKLLDDALNGNCNHFRAEPCPDDCPKAIILRGIEAKNTRLRSLLEVTAGRLDTERHRILAELEGL